MEQESRAVPLSRLRNIGIAAHIDAGKTTTTERILYYTGRSHRMGEVDEGTAVMDWDLREQERGITITAASTACHWSVSRGGGEVHQINIIDTPGHVDFTIEVERSLRVLDGVVALFCAVGGVQPQSETVWRQADRYGVPRIAFVNKMDRPGADLERCLEMMRARLGVTPVLVQLPVGEGEGFAGVVDLLEMQAYLYDDDVLGASWQVVEVPAELRDAAEFAREELLDVLTQHDEELTEEFLALDGAVSAGSIRAALRRATLGLRVVPVLCGASFRNKGVQPLLDAVVDWLPSPQDVPPVRGRPPGDEGAAVLEERTPSVLAPLSALAFKVMTGSARSLTYLRVYSGVLERGARVLNASRGVLETIGPLARMHANMPEPLERIEAGDIGVAFGLQRTITGDTLCDEDAPIILASIPFPEPVVQVGIEPARSEEHDRLAEALRRLALEDPSFRVSTHPETGQTLIAGMGELHLEIIRHRLLHDMGVEARVGSPQVSYRETLGREVEVEGRFIRSDRGRGVYGQVMLRLSPLDPARGIVFEAALPPETLPRAWVRAVEDGVREAADSGVVGGWPTVGVRVELIGASRHATDSSEMTFKVAALMGFRDGMRQGSPRLLEPLMQVQVTVPDALVGEVIGDIQSRRGEVGGFEARAGRVQELRAVVPLAELFGYAGALRSMTQGRATFTMRFGHYAPVPASVAGQVLGTSADGI